MVLLLLLVVRDDGDQGKERGSVDFLFLCFVLSLFLCLLFFFLLCLCIVCVEIDR